MNSRKLTPEAMVFGLGGRRVFVQSRPHKVLQHLDGRVVEFVDAMERRLIVKISHRHNVFVVAHTIPPQSVLNTIKD